MKKYLWIGLAVLLFYSCDNVHQIETESLKNALVHISNSGNYDWIVVLPGAGCHGCIQEGEYFAKQNISNSRILFVLTNISSLKIFQQKTGIVIKEHDNILVDRNNLFYLKTNNAIYPYIIELKNGAMAGYKFQSPQSAAFQELNSHLK